MAKGVFLDSILSTGGELRAGLREPNENVKQPTVIPLLISLST